MKSYRTRRHTGLPFGQVIGVISEARRRARALDPRLSNHYGRKGYSIEQLLVTHIVAQALGIRSAYHLAQVLSEDEPLRDLCGFGLTTPTARTLQRFLAAIEREPELRDAAHELGELLHGSAWWSGPRPSHNRPPRRTRGRV